MKYILFTLIMLGCGRESSDATDAVIEPTPSPTPATTTVTATPLPTEVPTPEPTPYIDEPFCGTHADAPADFDTDTATIRSALRTVQLGDRISGMTAEAQALFQTSPGGLYPHLYYSSQTINEPNCTRLEHYWFTAHIQASIPTWVFEYWFALCDGVVNSISFCRPGEEEYYP